MPKFRKKPVVIEAQLYDGTNAAALLFWIGSSPAAVALAKAQFQKLAMVTEDGAFRIRTLESGDGWHIADAGDWIIQGIQGEFYPCKPAIFAATYEEVIEA